MVKPRVLTEEQANRLREDFKRAAHIVKIIHEREKEVPITDELMRIAIKLFTEEHDALFSNFEGMLNGNGKGG